MSSSEMLSFAFSKKEHILMRNQNLVGLKLPELSEAAEQEKGRWGWGRCSSQPTAGFIFARWKKVKVNTRLPVRAFVCPRGKCGQYTGQVPSKYLQMNKLIRLCFLPTQGTSKLVSFQPALLPDPASPP